MKAKILMIFSIFLTLSVLAQKGWDDVDFSDEYKAKFKIKGGTAKALKKNKTFVNGYTISQATTMKGSEKTASKAVYSEVSLSGLENEAYQEMADELYREFIDALQAAGLQVTDGEDVMASDYVKDRIAKDKNDEYIGSTGDNPAYDGKKKITEGAIPGYGVFGVLNDVSFPPRNKNIYLTSSIIKSGNFYGKLAQKEEFNLLEVHYYVSFATFDGGRGYKDIKLATEPNLAVSVSVSLVTSGGWGEITYKDMPVWGGSDWSEGIGTTKDNKSDAEFLGLARSAEYQIEANQEKYLSEVKAIISNLQKDMVEGIKAEL